MQLKDYQQRVLDVLDSYVDELNAQRERMRKLLAANAGETDPDLRRDVPEFPRKAWEALNARGALPPPRRTLPYSSRRTGDGHDVPNATLKVPTGGGKTLLAAACVSRILARYLQANTGVVLWIVPNEAIFAQTRKQLSDRDHPYRQMLDRAAAGKVKVLTKESPLSRTDVEGSLCVLLLMLQSANRQTKETLRLFRDRGNVHGFVPAEADWDAHVSLLTSVNNLDRYADELTLQPLVKDSLGNVMRIVRPIVVMDEGHRAFAPIAYDTLLGFNPSFLLELTATPKDGAERWSNLLVDVSGADLDREEMIKLPINLAVEAGDDWRDCLRVAWERTEALQRHADELRANTARYIRPILVVQVERTGKDQREAGLIHAEDVRERLLDLGLLKDAVAVKTAEVNELTDPEKQDLRSPRNPVRAVITKQALQEGWDCPFAYTLCSLSGTGNLSAMTQMVGRILRQPDAQKTGVQPLDECYVYCYHRRTGDVVKAIKAGLEQDGMGDLAQRLVLLGPGDGAAMRRTTIARARRPEFAGMDIYLPKVVRVSDAEVRGLEWEADVLPTVDWSVVPVAEFAATLPASAPAARSETRRIGLEVLRDSGAVAYGEATPIALAFDLTYAARAVNDIVCNPWTSYGLVQSLRSHLKAHGWSDEALGSRGSFIIEEFRKWLTLERDRIAESGFRAMVADGRIQFRLRADARNWRLPEHETVELPERPAQFVRPTDGRPAMRSLFDPVYSHELNGLEFEVACYLDEHAALQWWYRNVALGSGFRLQGWRKNRVYPDFIVARKPQDGVTRLLVLETKGDQLEGNLDTEYKRRLMELATQCYEQEALPTLGTLELEFAPDTIVECRLVQQGRWQRELSDLIAPKARTAP